jgi:hypothetical protein
VPSIHLLLLRKYNLYYGLMFRIRPLTFRPLLWRRKHVFHYGLSLRIRLLAGGCAILLVEDRCFSGGCDQDISSTTQLALQKPWQNISKYLMSGPQRSWRSRNLDKIFQNIWCQAHNAVDVPETLICFIFAVQSRIDVRPATELALHKPQIMICHETRYWVTYH